MGETDFKLLCVDDGGVGFEAAVDNLSRAGLPRGGKAMLARIGSSPVGSATDARIRSQLPGWQFFSEQLTGPPEDAILRTCLWWSPDLLILGSADDRMIERPVDIAHRARCSVRVVRPSTLPLDGHVRLLIGNDGSKEEAEMISALALRQWPKDTEAKILSVLEKPSNDFDLQLANSSQALANQLCEAGLRAEGRMIKGDPARELLREAEHWNADAILLGAGGKSKGNRFLLGGVSTAVLSWARRPVEIVRT